MFQAIKNNLYPATALLILPVGYYIGTELRERKDAQRAPPEQPLDEEQIEKLRQQLEALKEERETVLMRQDLFYEQPKKEKIRAPSITTICLLQIQASIIQFLSNLPLKKQQLTIKLMIIQSLRWLLLIVLLVLDNIARLLNVEAEMMDITASASSNTKYQQHQQQQLQLPKRKDSYNHTEEELIDDDDEDDYSNEDDSYYLQKKSSFYKKGDQCIKSGGNTTNKKTTNNKRLNSPMNSPTPNFIKQTTRPSPILIPSRVNNGNHAQRARSLSNNMINNNTSPQKLRRITGQREITVQNAILPITKKKANSVISSSSTESITKPRIQKTMSLSTASYQHHECPVIDNTKRYERCCTACVSSTSSNTHQL